MVSYDFNPLIYNDTSEQLQTNTNVHPIKEMLPCVTNWPKGASNEFLEIIRDQYFVRNHNVNYFHYCILLHKAESLMDALQAFTKEGAFATHIGRTKLLHVINEAKNTEWCKVDLLTELERYVTYAFILDGTSMTCGSCS